MRIKKIRLQDFRNHQDSTLDIGDNSFVYVKGSNFAGKSSIRQGISMALTPSTTGLDAAGHGFTSKIRRGQSKAVITIVMQGGKHTVENVVTLNTNTSGRSNRATCLDDPEWHPAPFERILESNRIALGVALNTDLFSKMEEKAQKSLLARLALPSTYDFPKETVEAVEKALGEGVIDFAGDPFATIETAYQKLYKERELLNRQVKQFVVPESLAAPEVALDALQAKIADAQAERAKLTAKRDVAVKKASDATAKRARLEEKIARLETDIRQQQEDLTNIPTLSGAKVTAARKVAEGKAKLETLESERQSLTTKIEAKTAELVAYGDALEIGQTCPTCHQTIDPERITAVTTKISNEIQAARQRINAILQEEKALGDVAGALKALAEHDNAATKKTALEISIADNTKTLKQLSGELKALPDTVESGGGDLAASLSEVDALITSLTNQLRPVIAAEERAKEIAAKKENLARLQARAASVDGLVKYFDKDGIKAQLLKEHVGPFEDKLNEVMNAWGYRCSLSIDPWEFNVTTVAGVTTPVEELSGSEELMFWMALQCAVSRASGIGLIVVDELDTFLPSQRPRANKCLFEAVRKGFLEQVILIAADEGTEVPPLPNSVFFMVKNGTVERLGKG